MSSWNDGITNAIIKKTTLGYHDGFGSIKSSWLHLDYGGSGQAFGGYKLGEKFTDAYIYGILEALECDSWEDLIGKPIRVKKENGIAVAIGHLLKDQWFNPKETATKLGLK